MGKKVIAPSLTTDNWHHSSSGC